MIINSDWHIHTEASYDASLRIEDIAKRAKEFGFRRIGITDHANFNDVKFLTDLDNSVRSVKEIQKSYPFVVLGVELTPIEKPEFDYIAKNKTRDGDIAPYSAAPYEIELARTKDELIAMGVRYAIGGAHWRVDVPCGRYVEFDMNASIREWYRQQLWLAADERVTVLGHPWYNGIGAWYDDFSIIPRSMNMDIAAALKENEKYVECNAGVICSPKASERFRYQYTEFLRELFEMGIPITYGSDSHKEYIESHVFLEKYLISAGFREGDFSEISEDKLW